MVGAGNEALELIASERFDMAIVDLGLEDINPQASVRDIGGANPSIRIMLIPLAGEEVRDERKGVEVQGLLPKAFFVDDLSAIVGQAIAWGGETIPTSAAVSPRHMLQHDWPRHWRPRALLWTRRRLRRLVAHPSGIGTLPRRMLGGGGPRRSG